MNMFDYCLWDLTHASCNQRLHGVLLSACSNQTVATATPVEYDSDVMNNFLACALLQDVAHKCKLCRDITDDGLLALAHLQRLQTLVLNAMSQNVSGSFLSRLQGE